MKGIIDDALEDMVNSERRNLDFISWITNSESSDSDMKCSENDHIEFLLDNSLVDEYLVDGPDNISYKAWKLMRFIQYRYSKYEDDVTCQKYLEVIQYILDLIQENKKKNS